MKPWYQSKSIWGSVVMLLSLFMNQIGYQVTPEAQQEIVQHIALLGEAAGGLFALWGRIVAKEAIGREG